MDELSLFRDLGVGGVVLYVVARDVIPILRRWVERKQESDVPLMNGMPSRADWRLHIEGRVLVCEKMIDVLGNTCEDIKRMMRENTDKLAEIKVETSILATQVTAIVRRLERMDRSDDK